MRWAVGARQRLAPVGSDPLPQRIADGKRWTGARHRLAPLGGDLLPSRSPLAGSPDVGNIGATEDAGARHGLAPVGSDLLPGRSLLTRRFAAAAPATLRPPRQFGAARLAGVIDQSSRGRSVSWPGPAGRAWPWARPRTTSSSSCSAWPTSPWPRSRTRSGRAS